MSRITWVSCIIVVFLIVGLTLFGMGDLAPRPSSAAPVCTNLLLNSDMESAGGWIFGSTPAQGDFSTRVARSPVRSARLGITGGSNVSSFSSMRQSVSVPAGQQLTLKVWVFQVSETQDAGDVQEIQILRPDGTAVRTLWTQLSNDRTWKELTFDISEYIGRNLQIYINVYNNGSGGLTSMFVDDAYLELCDDIAVTATPTATLGVIVVTATPTDTPNVVTATPTLIVVTNTPIPTETLNVVTATPTPIVVTNTPTPTSTSNVVTATPTPIVVTNTPTPTPSGPIIVTNTPATLPTLPYPTATYTVVPPGPDGGCKECIVNGSFENSTGWKFGRTVLKAGYVGDNPHTDFRSVLSGNANYSRPNYTSYSSFRQKIKLPRGYRTAFLEFWHYTISNQESGDYQELVILDGNTGRTLDVMWRVNRNDQAWQQERFDMTRYLGKSIVVYFNTYNNGHNGRASMYVDDVSLKICPGSGTGSGSSGPKDPFPAHTVTPTPIMVATATPTITPVTSQVAVVVTATSTPKGAGGEIIGGSPPPPDEDEAITGTASPAPPTATPTLAGLQPTRETALATLTPVPGEGVGESNRFPFLEQIRLLLQCFLYLALIIVILFILYFLYRFIVALLAQRNP